MSRFFTLHFLVVAVVAPICTAHLISSWDATESPGGGIAVTTLAH